MFRSIPFLGLLFSNPFRPPLHLKTSHLKSLSPLPSFLLVLMPSLVDGFTHSLNKPCPFQTTIGPPYLIHLLYIGPPLISSIFLSSTLFIPTIYHTQSFSNICRLCCFSYKVIAVSLPLLYMDSEHFLVVSFTMARCQC